MSGTATIGGQIAWIHDADKHPSGYFHTFDNLALQHHAPRKVHVFIPRNYEKSDKRYPVVYMNDGDTAFWPSYFGKSWDIASRLSDLLQDKDSEVKEVIIVAVHPLNRDREYTYGAWELLREYGGVWDYAAFLVDAVKPFIDENYRTIRDTKSTAIVGGSLGGLASLITGYLRPDAFGVIGAFSPSLWAGLDDIYNLYPIVSPIASSEFFRIIYPSVRDQKRRPKLWIDWGLRRDGGEHNSLIEEAITVRSKELVDILTKQYHYKIGVDLCTFEDQIGGHDELAWGYRFKSFMREFFSDRIQENRKTTTPNKSKEQLTYSPPPYSPPDLTSDSLEETAKPNKLHLHKETVEVISSGAAQKQKKTTQQQQQQKNTSTELKGRSDQSVKEIGKKLNQIDLHEGRDGDIKTKAKSKSKAKSFERSVANNGAHLLPVDAKDKKEGK